MATGTTADEHGSGSVMISLETLATYVEAWSEENFGDSAQRGPIGPLKHLKLEADEAIKNPSDVLEYADCLILLLDASRRAGFTSAGLIIAAHAKMIINSTRNYEKPETDEPSQHVDRGDPA